jgi:cellulose synthase/poly-beta-1,6-N-acetylglucosamine synthase-like glycosyltransferase
MRSISIPKEITKFINNSIGQAEMSKIASESYAKSSGENPEVSIVMPAYNEEESIVNTLASLFTNKVNRTIEIIVFNNKSKERTEK